MPRYFCYAQTLREDRIFPGMTGGTMLRMIALAGITATLFTGCSEQPAPRSAQLLTRVFTVDGIYRSMKGPMATDEIYLLETEEPELLWITGYRAEMVQPDGVTLASEEFMCHSNLDYDVMQHKEYFNWSKTTSGRLFTLSQGQLAIEFPEGYGTPLLSNEALSSSNQVLNLNYENGTDPVRHKVSIDFIRDRDLRTPMKPLFMRAAFGLKLLEGQDGYYGVSEPNEEEHGEGCLMGQAAGGRRIHDGFGRTFIGHWVIKPGREENRTLATEWMDLAFDTTVHAIAIHVHPFAESLELRNLTTGESVFKSKIRGAGERIGISQLDSFAGTEGIPLFKDHEYELVSIYDNPTDQDYDSMAVMMLYMLDQEFEKPDLAALFPTPAEEQVVLRTDHGDVTIELYAEIAPDHVQRFLDLVRAGAYDMTPIVRVEPDYLIQTGAAPGRKDLPPLEAEFSQMRHKPGSVSMVLQDNGNPDSAQTSFFIMLDHAPALDRKYTVFGRVTEGLDAVREISLAPRDGNRLSQKIEIRAAEVVSGSLVATL